MPTSSNVLCGCGRLMGPIKNGVVVEELTEDGEPYKLWRADQYGCSECGATVITGFGREPIVEHYDLNYAAKRAGAGEIFPARCRPGTRVRVAKVFAPGMFCGLCGEGNTCYGHPLLEGFANVNGRRDG